MAFKAIKDEEKIIPKQNNNPFKNVKVFKWDVGRVHLRRPFDSCLKPVCGYLITRTIHPSWLISSGNKLWVRTSCSLDLQKETTVKKVDEFPSVLLNICFIHRDRLALNPNSPLSSKFSSKS